MVDYVFFFMVFIDFNILVLFDEIKDILVGYIYLFLLCFLGRKI